MSLSSQHGYGPGSNAGALSPLNTYDAIQSLVQHATSDHPRFPMGYSLDDTCGAVGAGELAIMLARSSAGKSTWYSNVIRNTPEVPTLVVNMEMTPRRQIEWLTSMTMATSVAAREYEEVLRNGQDDPRFYEVMSALEQMPDFYPHLHFVTPSRPTTTDLSILLDDIADSTGVRPVRVFIDHLKLMGGVEEVNYSSFTKTTADIHTFALKEDVAVYLLQQVGRAGDGNGGRNDGHLPVTISSGTFGGEDDADWIFGLSRPDKNPKFRKLEYQFANRLEYLDMRAEYEQVRGQVILQCVKNRPFGDLCEEGVVLWYDTHTRRYTEEP